MCDPRNTPRLRYNPYHSSTPSLDPATTSFKPTAFVLYLHKPPLIDKKKSTVQRLDQKEGFQSNHHHSFSIWASSFCCASALATTSARSPSFVNRCRMVSRIARCVLLSNFASFFSTSRRKSQFAFLGAKLNKS